MNFYAINTLWNLKNGQMGQQMTIAWASSEELAIKTHMDTCKKDPEKVKLIARDVVKGSKEFLEAVYNDLRQEFAGE